MSLFGALNSATAGLRTVQANVKVVSDNIARADDPDRTRHSLQQSIDFNGSVVTTDYRRELDNGLKGQLEDSIARFSASDTRSGYMQKLGDVMRTTSGQPLITKYADDFASAWRALETSPESEVAALQTVQAADTLAREIRRVSEGVEDVDREIKTDTENAVKDVNHILQQIHQINTDIVSLRTQGAAGNEVSDKRDGLIRELSEYVGVRTIERADGRIAVFTPSGLALVDSEPAQFSFDGTSINMPVGNKVQSITDHLQQGKLGAMVAMRKDGSVTDPPTAASTDPSTEIIRKLRSQLDAFANMFVAKTKDGEPTSFSDAYNNAGPLLAGEQDEKFFMGTDRFTLTVNQNLLDNKTTIKQSAIGSVVEAINATGRSLTADGLQVKDATYNGIASAITSNLTSISATVKDTAGFNQSAKELLEERYHGNTGVNIDEEIALLQQLQTSYAASARVMQVTNSMFDALEAIVR